MSSFDQEKFYLGNVCKRNHLWEETNQSLRYNRSKACVQCILTDSRARGKNPAVREKRQQAYTKWSKSEIGKATLKAYRQSPKGKSSVASSQLKYRQTEKGRATLRSVELNRPLDERRRLQWKRKELKRKRLTENNREYYNHVQVQELKEVFNHSCAYCGKVQKLTLDHFVPINLGGTDAIWNIVPACFPCNASKQDDIAEIWYRKQKFFSEIRWNFIIERMGNNG